MFKRITITLLAMLMVAIISTTALAGKDDPPDDPNPGPVAELLPTGDADDIRYLDGKLGIGTNSSIYRLFTADNSPGWSCRFFNEQGNANIWMCHGEKNGMQIRVDETTASNYLLHVNKDSETLFEVQGDGKVGIGTGAPGYRLHAIDNSPGWGYRFDNLDGNATVYMCNGAGYGMHIQNDDATASTYLLHLNNSGNALFEVTGDGKVGIGTGAPGHKLHVIGDIYATGTVTTGSSRELKNNINRLSGEKAVEALMSLVPVEYNYKTNADELELGFIAEDVPDLVARNDRKSLSPMDFAALSVTVIQELKKENEGLQQQVSQLLERMAALETSVSK